VGKPALLDTGERLARLGGHGAVPQTRYRFAGFTDHHAGCCDGLSRQSFDISVPLSMVAFLAGAMAFVTIVLLTDVTPRQVLSGVDWFIILFFVGLFVVLQGVNDSGLLIEMRSVFPGFGESAVPTLGWLTVFSAFLSNLVSNMPAVMLLGEMIPLSSTDLWLALASSSTLAGNATLIGAAANIIVAEKAEGMGVEVSFWEFFVAGLPMALLTLLISFLLLVAIV